MESADQHRLAIYGMIDRSCESMLISWSSRRLLDHLAATGKERKIRGTLPLFDQAIVDVAVQFFRMQVDRERSS